MTNYSALSTALLHLHKELIEMEKRKYEALHGAVTPHQYLELLTTHPSFQWLRILSQLIVSIDEAVDSKEDAAQTLEALTQEANNLIKRVDPSTEFSKKYTAAIEYTPEVAFAHGKVMEQLQQ